MARRINRFLKAGMHLGRLRLPTWLVGAGLPVLLLAGGMAAMFLASGQAVGPVLSGQVTGSSGVTAEQALTITSCSVTVHSGLDDSLCTVGPQESTFTAAIEMHKGERAMLRLGIANVSDVSLNAIMELSIPTGIDVEVEDSNATSTSLREAQLARTNWLLLVVNGNTETLDIILRPRPDLTPGFYTLGARIAQISG